MLICPLCPIDVWVAVWVKQTGPLKSGPKSSENKEKPLISCEISGDLVAGVGIPSYVRQLRAVGLLPIVFILSIRKLQVQVGHRT